jgi:hypothetical protein
MIAFNINPKVQTAKHAKYAKEDAHLRPAQLSPLEASAFSPQGVRIMWAEWQLSNTQDCPFCCGNEIL